MTGLCTAVVITHKVTEAEVRLLAQARFCGVEAGQMLHVLSTQTAWPERFLNTNTDRGQLAYSELSYSRARTPQKK